MTTDTAREGVDRPQPQPPDTEPKAQPRPGRNVIDIYENMGKASGE